MKGFEFDLLLAVARLHEKGELKATGYEISVEMKRAGYRIVGTGTLYRYLDKLVKKGMLASRWETPDEHDTSRPIRRFYWVTADARKTLAETGGAYQ